MVSTKKKNNGKISERHIGVLLEHLDDKISTVAEQYGDIKKALDTHTEMIGKIAGDLEMVKDDVGIIKEDIEFIKTDLKKKVDWEEFASLERRVATLEKYRK